ncbi:MAG: glutamine--tRNA ligase/YqeY domain fusion protein [Actinomycetia bacterium]|nr:glutamine--tRNA ligase/YqeY domain fusion protein [Actinomycetes bacterium]MCP4085334.1 glutamine--tRNA ligase/YqeY domain fusion protein [Actinomycetes bacterium]
MTSPEPSAGDPSGSVDFIRERIMADNESGTYGGRVQTRFPPEPNGYLHIGHAKAICLNFALAEEFGGTVRLRMDDTNPLTEDTDFIAGIEQDIAWLGFEPDGPTVFASDYFEQLYQWAESLIERGLAYVDDQDAETISAGRGGFGQKGTDSPWRDRSTEENLGQFRQMRDGAFDEGEKVLRAKIDMNSPNMWLRDPILYRIRKVAHYRTEDHWCIYPTYDWAHGQSDAIEGVTHSLCTLEFDVHRPLYEWCLDQLDLPNDRPQQIEFARLNITHTITSKRKLARLVDEGHVDGWDDPRMPTLRGLRRRGYPPAAIRAFMDHIGVARVDGTVEIELLESFVRTELNQSALRRMAVLRPLKVIITNWPEGQTDWLEGIENPEDPEAGTRQIPFTGELWIEQDDFKVEPPPKYYRLTPGREVRLRAGYFITAQDHVLDDDGNVIEVHCTYDPESRGGQAPDGRKVKSTIHWVSADHAVDGQVALYDRLFTDPYPTGHDDVDPLDFVNPASREVLVDVKLEPVLEHTPLGDVVQFERLGYFAHDPDQPMLFHRTVGLRDEWARIQKRKQSGG